MEFRKRPDLSLLVALERTDWPVDGRHLSAVRVAARTGRSLGVVFAVHGDGRRLQDSAAPSIFVADGHGDGSRLQDSAAPSLVVAARYGICAICGLIPRLQESAELSHGLSSDLGNLTLELRAGRVDATTGRSRGVFAGHGSGAMDSEASTGATAQKPLMQRHLMPTPRFGCDSRACLPCRPTKRRMPRSGAAAQGEVCWIYRRHSSWHAVETLLGWVKHGMNVMMQRLGLQAPFLLNDWSWIGVMGAPVVQFDNAGSCTLSACTSCTEAQHRLVYEKEHGWGSFPCKARIPPNHLRQECLKRRVWEAVRGAWTEDIFKIIKEIGGIPTTKATTKGVRLTVDDYTVFHMDSVPADLTSVGVAQLLYEKGPFVGVLWANDEYDECDGNKVYRGCPKTERNYTGRNQGLHAVVCFEFRIVGRELWIRIMDSYTPEGPCRWVLLEAFDCFILPRVTKALELP